MSSAIYCVLQRFKNQTLMNGQSTSLQLPFEIKMVHSLLLAWCFFVKLFYGRSLDKVNKITRLDGWLFFAQYSLGPESENKIQPTRRFFYELPEFRISIFVH